MHYKGLNQFKMMKCIFDTCLADGWPRLVLIIANQVSIQRRYLAVIPCAQHCVVFNKQPWGQQQESCVLGWHK